MECIYICFMARSMLTYLAGVPCVLLLLSTGLLPLCSCKEHTAAANGGNKPAGGDLPLVDVMIAAPRQISNQIEANGSVMANEYVELQPEISGRIVYLNVPQGGSVTKGTVIARINDADLQATLEKSKAQLELNQKTAEREKKLL